MSGPVIFAEAERCDSAVQSARVPIRKRGSWRRSFPLHSREHTGVAAFRSHATGRTNVVPQTGHTRDSGGLRVNDDSVVERDEGRADFGHRAVVVVSVDGEDGAPPDVSGCRIEGRCELSIAGAIVPYPPFGREHFRIIRETGVAPHEHVADDPARVLEGYRHPVDGARSSEGEQVGGRLGDAVGGTAPFLAPRLPRTPASHGPRSLEDDVAARLKSRAKRHGRSMEDEVRHILRSAALEEPRTVRKLGSRIAARFRSVGLTADLPELHGQTARAAEFDR